MAITYVILGAGLQGSAAAYDFAQFGDARAVILADYDLGVAEAAAQRLNKLTDSGLFTGVQVDATDPGHLGLDTPLTSNRHYFIDTLHLSPEGHRYMAEILIRGLAELGIM